MPVQNLRTGYDFAELYEVLSQGTTAITVASLPKGTMVSEVIVKVKTPAVGASNLLVGDDDDADGFTAPGDAVAVAGTLYGDLTTERGVYLYDATSKGGHVKLYTADKSLKFSLSAIPATSEGVYEVLIKGTRFGVS